VLQKTQGGVSRREAGRVQRFTIPYEECGTLSLGLESGGRPTTGKLRGAAQKILTGENKREGAHQKEYKPRNNDAHQTPCRLKAGLIIKKWKKRNFELRDVLTRKEGLKLCRGGDKRRDKKRGLGSRRSPSFWARRVYSIWGTGVNLVVLGRVFGTK